MIALAGVAAWSSAASARITFTFDYSLDAAANNFFNSSTSNGLAARAALEAAADVFSDRLIDTLSAITPSGSNTWTATGRSPITGSTTNFTVQNVPANTLYVYAAGRVEGGSTLAVGGYGGYSASGFQPWFDTLKGRGNTDALLASPTDFANWGGSISFNTSSTWNYSVTNNPVAGQNDFYSVAMHELGHLLGFGTAPSFKTTYTSNLQFTGPKAKALNGGNDVPLNNTGGHLAEGFQSQLYAGGPNQEAAMDPTILVGTRKKFTLMDWAGLDDLGWTLARPGDANADSNVNFNDLLVLAANYGTSNQTWSEGDFNYDGAINFNDLLLLASAYGSTSPLGEVSSAVASGAMSESFASQWALAQSMVPEPAAASVVLSLTTLACRRPRRAGTAG
ncbi:MAG: hypothetical protein QM770_07455 [Tepidisphaeraceae bacterium]